MSVRLRETMAGRSGPGIARPSRGEDRISRVWVFVEARGLLVLLVLFNLLPDGIGVNPSAGGYGSFVALLAPGFEAHAFRLSALWGMGLVLAMAKLAYGRWTAALRWADIGLGLVAMYVLVQLISGGPILAPGAAPSSLQSGIWIEGSRTAGRLADNLVKLLLGIALFGLAAATFERSMQLVDRVR